MTPAATTPALPGAIAWPHAPAAAAANATDRLLRALLCVYLATLVVEGPLRWAAALSGVPNLLYWRDAIPAGSLLVLVLRPLVQRRWLDLPVLLAGSALAVHALLGLVAGLAPFQVALGAKILLPVVYGLAMWPLLQDRWPAVVAGAAVVTSVTLAGLAVNFAAGPMPWEGLEYDTAFGAVSTTWRWWIDGGIPRLSGFARVSFNAAMLLGLSSLVLLAGVGRHWLRLLLVLAVFLGILVTTSKGMLLAFPVAAAWLLLPAGEGAGRLGRWTVWALCALGLLLPATIVAFDVGAGMQPEDWPVLILSAWQRFSEVWPEAFQLPPPGLAGLLGTGLGGIGTPQLFGHHPHLFNPADSLAVFLLVDFGVAGAVYYLLPALALRRAQAVLPEGLGRALLALLIVAYGYGLSISMLEEPFFTTTLGLLAGALVSARGRRPAR